MGKRILVYVRFVAALSLLTMLFGCASISPAKKDVQREFTYDFIVKGRSQTELWKKARDFFAEMHDDSRSVFSEKGGTIIGRGVAVWSLLGTSECRSDYHVRFASKNEKARLQLELIDGVPFASPCPGWSWPSASGYDEIVSSFNAIAKKLDTALKDNPPVNKLKDF